MQNAIHAAPKGAWPSIRGGRYYKHGAPNGAGNIFVAQDTYKVQAATALSPGAERPGWFEHACRRNYILILSRVILNPALAPAVCRGIVYE